MQIDRIGAHAVDRVLASSGTARGKVFVEHVSVVPFGVVEVAVVVLLLTYDGVTEQLSGSAIVGDDAGLPINLDELASVAESGAIRVAGTIAALKLEPGSYTIVLAVGRPDELPADVAQVLTGGDGAPWMARRIEIVIED